MKNILVVCVGNVCRSPVAERLLQANAPNLNVTSAGLGALEGHAADQTAASVAQHNGVSLEGHVARQADEETLSNADLILVMEDGHRKAIAKVAPQVLGRVMLLGHWDQNLEIPDPFRKSEAYHQAVFDKIAKVTKSWATRLARS